MDLARTYPSDREALSLARALAADRPSFLGTTVEGATLRIHLDAPSAESARATLEDLMSCLAAAERTMGVVPAARPGPRAGAPP